MSGQLVEVDPFAGPWSIETFAAAILANGPIRVPRTAMNVVRQSGMGLAIYQEWDERTQTMTYTVPEHG